MRHTHAAERETCSNGTHGLVVYKSQSHYSNCVAAQSVMLTGSLCHHKYAIYCHYGCMHRCMRVLTTYSLFLNVHNCTGTHTIHSDWNERQWKTLEEKERERDAAMQLNHYMSMSKVPDNEYSSRATEEESEAGGGWENEQKKTAIRLQIAYINLRVNEECDGIEGLTSQSVRLWENARAFASHRGSWGSRRPQIIMCNKKESC